MAPAHVRLGERPARERGGIHLTAIQALAGLPVMPRQRDEIPAELPGPPEQIPVFDPVRETSVATADAREPALCRLFRRPPRGVAAA